MHFEPGTARPEDFPVGSLESRAAARALLLQTQRRFRMIFCCKERCEEEPLNLDTSTCKRQTWPDGSLVEIICLDGSDSELTEEEFEAFIAGIRFARGR